MANTGNTQQQINYGAAVNDGNGDPLRTAFIKTDDNFDNVWLAGPVGSNITITNNTVQVNNTNGNLILSPNGIGVIQTNSRVVPRLNNTYDLGSTTQKYRAGYFGIGGLTVDGNVNITGNLTAGNISYTSNVFVGDLEGSVFADDSTIMVDAIDNVLYAGRAAISGNVSATYFIGNGSQLTGLAATYGNANVVANLAALGSNPISTTGNVTANYFVGNGRQLTGVVSSYGNANVANYLPTFSGNISAGNVSATGNVTGAYIKGNGSELTSLPAPVVTQDITSNGAMSIMTYDGVIKYVNYATVEPSSGNIVGGNITTTGLVSATGNITGNYFIGNGSQLTGISSGIQSSIANGTSNVNIATANGNATITANAASTWTFGTDSTLTLPAGSSRITSYGQITIETDNNASGMYLNADGVNLLYANANVTLRANSTGTNKDWNFGNTGVLTLPNADATGFGNIYFEENSSTITFGLDDNATPYLYSFSTSGITLPKGGIVSEGVAPTGLGNTIAITPSGGSDANQQLLVYPTGNIVEGNHLHLTTGDLYNTELFLGNDNLYVKLANTGNVVVNTDDTIGNTAQWTFGTDGNLTLPGNIIAINYADGNRVIGDITFSGEAVIGTGTSNTQSGLYLAPDPVSLTNDLYLRVRGNIYDEPTHIHFDTGNNAYYNQYIGDDNKYILLANTGNVVVNTNDNAGNSAQWNFNNFGTLTLPGGSRLSPLGANLDIFANGGYVNLITADESSRVGVSGAGGFITTAGGTWQFGTTGNLTAPGNISAAGNILTGSQVIASGVIESGTGFSTGGYLSVDGSADLHNTTVTGNLSATGNVTAQNFIGNISITGNVIGTQPNVTLVAGSYDWTFDNTGNLTLPGNTFAVNYADNTLVDVVTRFEGSWTVPTGNSTQSFTVTPNNTYNMWVEGNIPNGIIVWNATATITNTNVPVAGVQYAWVYNGGGTPIDFTSIPNQFEGTANTIVRSNVAPSTTTNRFDFGINNTSGNTQVVRYGWIKIS